MSGGSYFANAGVFLVDTVFGIYLLAVMLRFFLQLVRADFYNPLCQAIVTITNPPLRILRRFVPPIRTIDTSSILLMIILQLTSSYLVVVLLGVAPSPMGLLVGTIAELLSKTIYLFMFAILIQIVASWIAPGSYNPILDLLDSLTAPIMRPARNLLPPMGGIDLSPMLAIIGLTLSLMLIVAPLRDFGRALL
ncbi:MAG: YggT family protein [Gammaproteobacteria bacterium]|jgi:YggT family protein